MGKGRAPCCDKNQVKRGPWSPAEDLRLITFIQKHGHDNWRSLPKQAGLLRCGKSCRLRWINYLRPDVKRGNFTQEEEDSIIKLHKAWGNKWSKIASRLPGRTDNEIKNVWNTHLKKRLEPTKANSDNNNISGDDEESKQSPTPSSSSSSSLISSNELSQNLIEEQIGCEPNDNSKAVAIDEEPKEQQTSCSALSFESTTNTSNSDTLWPDQDSLMDSQFEFVEINNNINKTVLGGGGGGEVEKKHMDDDDHHDHDELEIPFECDIDFWNMLDLDNIELFHSDEAEVKITRETETERERELDNNKWIRYLENELGLDDQQMMLRDQEEDSGGERFVDSQDLNWSISNPQVDDHSSMAYFQMGSPHLCPHNKP